MAKLRFVKFDLALIESEVRSRSSRAGVRKNPRFYGPHSRELRPESGIRIFGEVTPFFVLRVSLTCPYPPYEKAMRLVAHCVLRLFEMQEKARRFTGRRYLRNDVKALVDLEFGRLSRFSWSFRNPSPSACDGVARRSRPTCFKDGPYIYSIRTIRPIRPHRQELVTPF